MKGCDGKIVEGEVYQHFKGGLYKVIEVRTGYHDDIAVVLYQSLADFKLHTRISTDFCADVFIWDNKTIPRFSLVQKDDTLEAIRLARVILDFHPNSKIDEGWGVAAIGWGEDFRNAVTFEDERTKLYKSSDPSNKAILIEYFNDDNIWNPMICTTPDGDPYRQHGEICQAMDRLRKLYDEAIKEVVRIHKEKKAMKER
jgi:hypothetical protein